MDEGTDSAKKLIEAAQTNSLIEMVLEFWLGRKPEETEAKILEEIMVLSIDHRAEAPSAKATIAAALGGQDVIRSVEAGLGEINESHGGAIEGFGKILQEDNRQPEIIVKHYLDRGLRIPGLGHRVYQVIDPRTEYMFQRLKDLGFEDKYIKKATAIADAMEKIKGRRLVINIDGGMAVVLSQIGVKPALMNVFFMWPRIAGLVYRWQEAQSSD